MTTRTWMWSISLSFDYKLLSLYACFVTFKAFDADKEHTNNSEVKYSLMNISEPSVHLTIDENNGNIYLQAPVVFGMLENNTGVSGEVKIIVEARDCGVPSLRSNVTFTLNIQVLFYI